MQQKLERSSSDSERPQDGHGHAEARTHTSMGAGGAAVGCRRAADGAEPRTAVELYRALTNYVMYTYGMDGRGRPSATGDGDGGLFEGGATSSLRICDPRMHKAISFNIY